MQNIKKIKKEIKQAVDLYKLKKFIKAESLTKTLIKKYSKIGFLYNLLGLILVEQKKYDEAVLYYKKGILNDPKFAMIYNNLGLLYATYKNEFQIAEDLYKKSISIDDKLPEAYNNLGSLYNSLARYDESVESYKKAIKINPNFVPAYHNLGHIYTSLGDFINAIYFLKKAIKIDPLYTKSHRTLSRLLKYTYKSEHFEELKNIYEKINFSDLENKTNVAFALGKAYEDIKDFDNSFKYYNEANKKYGNKINYKIDKEKIKFKSIKSTFNKKLYQKYLNVGNKSLSPIFILGMPRSGTTLVEQILSNHSKVFGGDEQDLITDLLRKNFGNNDLRSLFNGVVDFDIKLFAEMGEEYVYKMKNLSKNSEFFTDKLPENFFWIGFIKLILPNSKIIHSYRNAEDNCLSIFKNHFPSGKINYSYNLYHIVEYYNLYKDLIKHWEAMFPNFIYKLKYENLISNIDLEVKNLLKFCNLPWDKNCIEFHKNQRVVKTASDVQSRNKLYQTSVNSWKNFEKFLKPYFDDLA